MARFATWAFVVAAGLLAASASGFASDADGRASPSDGAASVSGPVLPDPREIWRVRPGLEIERVATALDLPVSIASAPNGGATADEPLLYFTELYGNVLVMTGDHSVSTYASGLLNFDPFDFGGGLLQNGVTGITVDPESGDVFVSLVYLEDGGILNRVLRLESSDDGMSAVSEQIVIDGFPSAQSHQVAALTIGPDGKLYVNTADGLDLNAPQDDDDLRGKILRLNLDGSIPEDNPTPGSPAYAKGFRDPFGAAWHPEEPWLYASDNGVIVDDRILRVEPGGNYGWCCDLTQNALYIFDWEDALSPTNIDFDRDHLLTREDQTHLLVAITGPTLADGTPPNGKKVFDMTLDADGEVDRAWELLRYVGEGYATVIGVAFGADGLYFSDLYGETAFVEGPIQANIYRVSLGDDRDGDGCTDDQELAANPALGGGRDPANLWDFFDTPDSENRRDGAVTAADLVRVVARFGATGDPKGDPFSPPPPLGYHTAFDRTPPGGTTGSDEQEPDGATVAQDIALAVEQFGHTCVAS